MPTITASSPVTNTYKFVGVLCTAITDEGSRRLMKRLKFVAIMASVYKPQSCQKYLAAQDYSYYKHLPSDLSCYCHFDKTLLILSQVVDTSTIYLRVCCRCICGYHVYKQVWSVSVGDILY